MQKHNYILQLLVLDFVYSCGAAICSSPPRIVPVGGSAALIAALCLFAVSLVTQDGGDPDVAVSPRDIVFALDAEEAARAAAGSSQPSARVMAATDLRCGGVSWCDGEQSA